MSTIRAREYRRLSKDQGGSSIEEQAQDNAQAASVNGWELGESYEDADRSASRYKTRERDDFTRLVSDLRTGRFAAQVLILWESSRGSRDVGEWDALIKSCEKRRVLIHVTSHHRTYDPRNHRDRRTLLEDAVDSAYESDKTSVRIRHTTANQAAKGRPHGLAPYGLKPVYDPETRALQTWAEDTERSFVPKELFRLLEAGHTLTGVARTFTERGWVNLNTGRPFTRHHLRNMAIRAAYAGIRVHTDPETGQTSSTPGTWEAIVPPERFWAVQRILCDPSRRTARNGAAKYELSMTLKCNVCSGPLTVTRAHLTSGRESYICRKSHVFVCKADVDALVIPRILGYLARPEIHAELAAPDGDERVAKVRADLAETRAALTEMEAQVPESAAHARVLARGVSALEAKISSLEDEERRLTISPVMADALAADNVVDWWLDAPVSARREVARIVLSPGLLGEVRVTRTSSAGHTPDVAERLVWIRGA
ncbi:MULTISPECIES: recombinase family protein [unclassified Streptomyces]|uniref:recombinase family protein n=1 Tax=unclassified Streptomyces TaxID=2593676 RepID=UPI002366C11D|nr:MULTISPECIES: recombinase family protein [unclassified Streptomyces]MDF3141781.1 recombinase family protein [Streptomyces sp. T21Q-yed]WDF36444.1 recombinase family protein [Streptomyces sp. T12]